jgi:hypothetical protein
MNGLVRSSRLRERRRMRNNREEEKELLPRTRSRSRSRRIRRGSVRGDDQNFCCVSGIYQFQRVVVSNFKYYNKMFFFFLLLFFQSVSMRGDCEIEFSKLRFGASAVPARESPRISRFLSSFPYPPTTCRGFKSYLQPT